MYPHERSLVNRLEKKPFALLGINSDEDRGALKKVLEKEKGVFIAASDYMKLQPESISRWVPGGLVPLGTDGFGRSESRPSLRRFFEVDAECITLAALGELARRGEIKTERVQKAIKELDIDPEKADPVKA